jgi:sterol desaturase/sphingolipid hydroxylase (fatty acid hydroxylase superfamily)
VKCGLIKFNTPSQHRVHHGTNPQYLDRNHAGIFIIWDKQFGMFEPENDKPIYGLVENIETYSPVKIVLIDMVCLEIYLPQKQQ